MIELPELEVIDTHNDDPDYKRKVGLWFNRSTVEYVGEYVDNKIELLENKIEGFTDDFDDIKDEIHELKNYVSAMIAKLYISLNKQIALRDYETNKKIKMIT